MARPKTKYPYFPFYPKDFAADNKVEAMALEEVGAFVLLLCKAWEEDVPGTLPDDDTTLARWARMSPDAWKRSREKVLSPFTKEPDGRLHQKKMKQVFEELKKRYRAASSASKRRWSKRNEMQNSCANDAETHAEGMREGCYQNQTQNQNQIHNQNHTQTSSPPSAGGGEKPPKKPRKKAKAPRPQDPLWDALARITGTDPVASASYIAKVYHALRGADPPYTAEDVEKLPGILEARGWKIAMTLGTVEKYIGLVRAGAAALDPFERTFQELFGDRKE